jgi:hypothetical protein
MDSRYGLKGKDAVSPDLKHKFIWFGIFVSEHSDDRCQESKKSSKGLLKGEQPLPNKFPLTRAFSVKYVGALETRS